MFSSGSEDRLAAASPVRAAGCRGLHVRLAWRSLFFVFTPLHACRPSGQPFFSACFPLFPTSTRKCECVCVCVCVFQFGVFPRFPRIAFKCVCVCVCVCVCFAFIAPSGASPAASDPFHTILQPLFRISYTPCDFNCRSSLLDTAMAWY